MQPPKAKVVDEEDDEDEEDEDEEDEDEEVEWNPQYEDDWDDGADGDGDDCCSSSSDADEPGYSDHHMGFEGVEDQPVAEDAGRQQKRKISEDVRRQTSRQKADQSHCDFNCKCSITVAKGFRSCLDQFYRHELVGFQRETYGDDETGTTPSGVRHSLLCQLFPLRVSLPEPDHAGHLYAVPQYKLDHRMVCQAGWRVAVGGSNHIHRTVLSLVLNGTSPASDVMASLSKSRMKKACPSFGGADMTRRESAVRWWMEHLLIQDFLPNETPATIQYRGPCWSYVWKQIYCVSEPVGGAYSYKAWKDTPLQEALQRLAAQHPGAGNTFRLVRSARHSSFAECTNCQVKRRVYFKLASNRNSDAAAVAVALKDFQDHMATWRDDRLLALRLRNESYDKSSPYVYECDDKCGSEWQSLPANDTGRASKDEEGAGYDMSVQANVVTGPNGLLRCAVVPRNVGTGSNFGLSTLILALHSAFQLGKLNGKEHLLRHTDGGSDNLSRVTHCMHWLFVNLGIFQELTWFRFDSGHSHTEIADRLFGMMKRLFKTDSNARAVGCEDFVVLEVALRKLFDDQKEDFEMVFHFANWDFQEYFKSMNLSMFESASKSAKALARFSFDNVFNYKYVGEPMFMHGGVLVRYKRRLSTKGTHNDAEWLPIKRTKRLVPSACGEMEEIECNETEEHGVVFMDHPPDLRAEPPREAFAKRQTEGEETVLFALYHYTSICICGVPLPLPLPRPLPLPSYGCVYARL